MTEEELRAIIAGHAATFDPAKVRAMAELALRTVTAEREMHEAQAAHTRAITLATKQQIRATAAERQALEMREALSALYTAYAAGFVTCESDGANSRYAVTAKFRDLKAAQNGHRTLLNACLLGRSE